MRDTQREAETQAEGEAGLCRKPDVEPHPGTPGSGPGPKAGAQPLSHPGVPSLIVLNSTQSVGWLVSGHVMINPGL